MRELKPKLGDVFFLSKGLTVRRKLFQPKTEKLEKDKYIIFLEELRKENRQDVPEIDRIYFKVSDVSDGGKIFYFSERETIIFEIRKI